MHIKRIIKIMFALVLALSMFGINTPVNAEEEKVTVTVSTNITKNEPWADRLFLYQDANGNKQWDEGETRTTTAAGKLKFTLNKGDKLTTTKARLHSDLEMDMSTVDIVINTDIGAYKAGEVFENGKDCSVDKNAEIEFRVPLAEVTVEAKDDCDDKFYEYMYLDMNASKNWDEGEPKFTEKTTFKIPSTSKFTVLHPRVFYSRSVEAKDVKVYVNDVEYTTESANECPTGDAHVVFEYVGACPVKPTAKVKFIDCDKKETEVTVELTKEEVDVASPWGVVYKVSKDSVFTQTNCPVPEPEPKTYKITFTDCDDKVIEEVEVKDGDVVTVPEGYEFDETLLKEITEDITLKATNCEVPVDKPEPTPTETPVEKVKVTFKDCNGEVIQEVSVEKGGSVNAPKGFGFESEDLTNITEDLTLYSLVGCEIEPEPQPETVTVEFLDCKGNVISSAVVKKGDSLTLAEGQKYDDTKLTNIQNNLRLSPTNCEVTPTPSAKPTKAVVNTGNDTTATPYLLGGTAVLLCAAIGYLVYLKKNKK